MELQIRYIDKKLNKLKKIKNGDLIDLRASRIFINGEEKSFPCKYKIKDIGDVISESIYDYINNQNNIDMINELLKYITFNKEKENVNINQSLQDKTFVITGNVYLHKNRKELQKIIEKLGGKITRSVSKNTNFLINNDIESNSSKNKKAKKLNIPIITEEQFNKMINK